MKRGTPEHPKVADLCAALEIPRYSACGILELLWHFAARYALGGDVGRFSDKAIANAIGWRGSPKKLVTALVECKWLDEDPTHRLLVHDWHEHADQTVLRVLRNRGETMLARSSDNASTPPTQVANTILASQSLKPIPIPIPVEQSGSPRTPMKDGSYHKDTRTALHWLNDKAGTHYQERDSHLRIISARLNEPGTTIEGVKQMLENQIAMWRGTDMAKYLRPSTLFGKEKFGTYYDSRDMPLLVNRSNGPANSENIAW